LAGRDFSEEVFDLDRTVNQLFMRRLGNGGGWQRTRRAREWIGYTPDGRRLVVRREHGIWLVSSNEAQPVRHRILDLALIAAIRPDVDAHSLDVDYGEWTRLIADSIESTWPAQ
jgi:hypothetical protein